ncbi:hypothetical protein FRC08_017584 [Ceratobasidium sp. 394]|nr:hypothetical protein FRC08_017584 [Ceratobasidium sp. 394]
MRGQGMIPACMSLLQNCHQKGKLLNCAYGYLSLRTLCLVLEMCTIAHHPILGAASEVGIWVNTFSESVASALGEQVAISCASNIPFLVWESYPSTAYSEVFSFAGGLTSSHVRFLVDALFDGRDVLLDVCLKFGLPGLSTLLVILWQFAVAQSNNQLLWERLDILQRRNYIVSPEVDRPITRTLFKPFSSRSQPSSELSLSVDGIDAENLVQAFRRNLRLVSIEDSGLLLLRLNQAVGILALHYAPHPD